MNACISDFGGKLASFIRNVCSLFCKACRAGSGRRVRHPLCREPNSCKKCHETMMRSEMVKVSMKTRGVNERRADM